MLLALLIVCDTHKDDLSTVTLEGIRIVLCLDLVNGGLHIHIPFQLDQQNRVLGIVFRKQTIRAALPDHTVMADTPTSSLTSGEGILFFRLGQSGHLGINFYMCYLTCIIMVIAPF